MGFCGYLKQSTSVDILLGPFIDDTDGKSAETGLTIDVELSKNGQALADSESAAPTHDAAGTVDGYYNCVLGTTDTGTLGILSVVAHAAGFLPVHQTYQVVTAHWYDTMCSTDKLQVDVTQWLGQACHAVSENGVPKVDLDQIGGVVQSLTDFKDFVDTGYDPTNHKAQSDLIYIHGSALTETAGQLAAAFIKFFDVAAPTATALSLPDAVPGAAGGGFIAGTNAATTITTALTAAITGNITGNLSGTVGTVTTNTDLVTAAAIKTAMEAANSDLDRLMIALVNKKIITKASGNVEQFTDADVSIGTIAGAITSDATTVTQLRMAQ